MTAYVSWFVDYPPTPPPMCRDELLSATQALEKMAKMCIIYNLFGNDFVPQFQSSIVNPPPPPRFYYLSLPYSQRWFPLSPPTLRAEDPLLGGEGWAGVGGAAGMAVGGGVGLHANATEQRRAADFAHYNPIIQVQSVVPRCCGWVGRHIGWTHSCGTPPPSAPRACARALDPLENTIAGRTCGERFDPVAEHRT